MLLVTMQFLQDFSLLHRQSFFEMAKAYKGNRFYSSVKMVMNYYTGMQSQNL